MKRCVRLPVILQRFCSQTQLKTGRVGSWVAMRCFCLQTYSQLAHPIQQAKATGLKFHSKILDIDNIDVRLDLFLAEMMIPRSPSGLNVFSVSQLAMGKMMDQGPVLIITFQAQLVMVIQNPKGEVVEGDPVSSWYHICCFCKSCLSAVIPTSQCCKVLLKTGCYKCPI